jgi:hypothetical protein
MVSLPRCVLPCHAGTSISAFLTSTGRPLINRPPSAGKRSLGGLVAPMQESSIDHKATFSRVIAAHSVHRGICSPADTGSQIWFWVQKPNGPQRAQPYPPEQANSRQLILQLRVNVARVIHPKQGQVAPDFEREKKKKERKRERERERETRSLT